MMRGATHPRLIAPAAAWARLWARYRAVVATAGALVCAGQMMGWYLRGAWLPHDSANIWLAGRHLIEGEAVYGGTVGGFLTFVYPPPAAVMAGLLSLLPPEVVAVGLLALQVLALRWIVGSWTNAALVGWLPAVPRALVTGNVDFLVAAAILAGVLRVRHGGYLGALMTAIKMSPILAVTRWREFAVGSAVLIAITLPWLELWPAWVRLSITNIGTPVDGPSLLMRIPIVLALLALRRPWSVAAAAGLATPAFYWGHSAVLLLPAARLYLSRGAAPAGSVIAP